MIVLEAIGILMLLWLAAIPVLRIWERSIARWNAAEDAAWREEHPL